jgi:hypothetical protein
MSVDALSQTTAQKMGGALGGVTAGFELGAGAMGAFGANSEQVEEALLRVQSAMAISQGIQGIREAIPAFKALRTAIMSTTVVQGILNFVMSLNPIGVIIAGVVALGAAIALLFFPIKALLQMFGLVSDNAESAAEANERLNKAFERQDEILDKLIKTQKKQSEHKMKMMQAEGATEKELHEQRLRMLKEEENGRKAQMALLKDQLQRQNRILRQAINEGDEDTRDAAMEELQAKKEKYEELEAMNGDYNNAVAEENADARKNEAAAEKADQAERLSKYKEHLARLKEADDIHLATLRELKAHELSLIDDEFERERAIINNNYAIKREDLLANFKGTEEDKAALKLAYDEQEQIALDVLHAKRLEDAKAKTEELALATRPQGEASDGIGPEAIALEVENEEMKQQALFNVKEKFDIASNAMRDASASKEAARVSSALDNASSALSSVNDLSNMLTDLSVQKAGKNEAAAEAARKKGFERSKKIQIGMAIIQGIQGTMAAFTAGSAMGPAGVVMGPLMGALAAAGAIVNIAKIKNSKYEGGGSAPTGGGGGRRAPNPPSFNIVGNSSENQLATSLGGKEEPVIKTYVVSEDVTTAQSLDRNRVDTATL